MDWIKSILNPATLPLLIPIVAIVAGVGFACLKVYFNHAERMEKIRNGIDPDAKS